jgi:Slime mold cyclic AMP receptor
MWHSYIRMNETPHTGLKTLVSIFAETTIKNSQGSQEDKNIYSRIGATTADTHINMGDWGDNENKALALIPKITGGCSCAFSALIVYTIVRTRERPQHTYERLLVGMSFWDMTCSFWYAMSTWPISKESKILWAIGNETSCKVQGAFIQMTIVGALYNGSLSFYYLLVIRYGWKEPDFQKRPWVQALFHAIPIVWGIGTVIAEEELFDNAILWCWIPEEDHFERFAFHYGPLWTTIFVVTVNLILTVLVVRQETIQAENNIRANALRSAPVEEIAMVDTSANVGDEADDTGGVSEAVHATGSHGAVSSSGNSNSTGLNNIRTAPSHTVLRLARCRSEITNQCILYAVAFYMTWLPMTVRTKGLRIESAPSIDLP